MSWVISSNSPLETEELGERLGKILVGGEIIALVGELGAGKTLLTKGIARGIGYQEDSLVASPSYVLVREYPAKIWLYHFDFYRLNSLKELEALGYEEYFDGQGVCVIEWAEKFPSIFPKSTLWVKLIITGENQRKIEINSLEEKIWQDKLSAILNKFS